MAKPSIKLYELMPQPEEEPDKPRLSLRELLHAHRKGEQNGNQD